MIYWLIPLAFSFSVAISGFAADVIECDDLVNASKLGNLECVQRLLDECADPNSRDESGYSALWFASANGHLEVVNALLAAGADAAAFEPDPTSALYESIKSGNVAIVEALLKAGASSDYSDAKGILSFENPMNSGGAPLRTAASYGHLDVVKLLLRVESDYVAKREKTRDAQRAAFIEANRDDPSLQSFLDLVKTSPQVEIPRPIGGKGALESACWNEHTDIVGLLLDAGVGVDTELWQGRTALIIASCLGNESLIDILLEAGACVDARTDSGVSALLAACQNGHLDAVRSLLTARANKGASDDDGQTPLMAAATNGHFRIAKLLIESGADLDAIDSMGRTALMRSASEQPKYHVIESGQTSQIMATTNGNAEMARILLNAGADTEVLSLKGKTALQIARELGNEEVAELIQNPPSRPEF